MRSSRAPAHPRRMAAAALLLLAGCDPAPTAPPSDSAEAIVFAITVTDSLGDPLEGARVVVDHLEDFEASGLTDADGRFSAHSRAFLEHDVYAAAGSLAGYREFSIADADPRGPIPITLTLHRAVVVRGVARLAGRTVHTSTIVLPRPAAPSATTDSAGAWSISNFPARCASSVLFSTLGFGYATQSFTTGAPGDTLTLPTVTLVSDPGGTRARRP